MVAPNNSRSRLQYNEMVKENLKVLMKENIQTIQIGSVPEFLPIETRAQDWLKVKGKFSNIPFEDNDYWVINHVTNYYLNTLNIFCPEGVCSNRSHEGWLYYDDDHLSELGARSLITELDPIIKEIIKRKS
jgi:hypothetical protein